MNASIRDHCSLAPRAVLFDEAALMLLDVASGKTLALAGLASADPGERTVRLAFGDGRSVALTADGIAFAPGFVNTGPLHDLPAAVCWKDFQALAQQLKQALYGTVPPTGATVRVLMCCLAIVDGARAAGFDVSPEEAELEWHLRELERLAPEG